MATWESFSTKKSTGNRISPGTLITALDAVAISSAVTWTSTLPTGTSVAVDVGISFDGGVTWSPWYACTYGQACPVANGVLKGAYIRIRETLTTTDTAVSPLLISTSITITMDKGFFSFQSAPKDVSQATDKSSGKVTLDVTAGTDAINVFSRSAVASGGPYTRWELALPDGALQHPADNFYELLVCAVGTDATTELKETTVNFDIAPTMSSILTGMTTGAEYTFTTLKDILVIANGKDAPRKWTGTGATSLLGGSPPVLDSICTHQNRVWGIDAANPSRVRFSDILDPETWSVLNFMDFNPEDGDRVTAMTRAGQDLLITKQRSMALLTGTTTTNYSIVWLNTEQGATGKRAIYNTNKYLAYVAQDGIRFTDFNTSIVATERLTPDWNNINKRRLNQAAMIYWRNTLLVALPADNSLYNNTVWVYDFLRNAWSINTGWNVSAWCIFNQYGEDVLLACDSMTGQVYEAMKDNDSYDDTVAKTYKIRTKDFTFKYPERYKLFRAINLDLSGATEQTTLYVTLYVDGVATGQYSTILPAGKGVKYQRMILPPLYDAVIGRALSLEIEGRCGIQGISITYSIGGIVPDGGIS